MQNTRMLVAGKLFTILLRTGINSCIGELVSARWRIGLKSRELASDVAQARRQLHAEALQHIVERAMNYGDTLLFS